MIPDSVTNIGIYAFQDSGLINVTTPESITSISYMAFAYCFSLENVTICSSITNIGIDAFYGCYSLSNIYFLGNAPTADSGVFSSDNLATAYYLPNTTGWVDFTNATGVPIALWLPQVQTTDGNFGVHQNIFGFNINWASGQTVVVKASTDLINWVTVQTNTLTTDSSYFNDPQWTNYPNRFYKLSSP